MLIHDPIILWSIVGIVSGIILGVAGAGGGLISIPMLMYLGGYGIKDATGYGLWVLTIGAALTWFVQRHNTNYPVTLVLTFSAAICAYISAPLKLISPPWFIILLLNAACFFSLYNLWILKIKESQNHNTPLFNSVFGGAIAGSLNTMTGLGGGVIMIPWLVSYGKLRLTEATASSLMVISLIAPFSVWAQGRLDIPLENIASLTSGVVLAAALTRSLIHFVSEDHMNILRKVILTSAILSAMIGTLLKL